MERWSARRTPTARLYILGNINMRAFVLVILLIDILVDHDSEAAHLTEGSRCVRDGVEGTCINIYKCQSVILDFRDKKSPPTCGFQGNDPLVCCTDCIEDRVANISYAVLDPHAGLLWKNAKKYWDACIDYIHTLPYACKEHITSDVERYWDEEKKCHHIALLPRAPVGGEDTKRGEFPFMALLGYGADLDSAQWLCGGSLISERFILTAAHCIASVTLGPVKFVSLGVWKRDDPTELWQRHVIQKIIPHPDYHAPNKYHDIALLQTEKTVQFTLSSLPACLHSGEPNPYKGRADALGWGYLGPKKPLANVLQKVELMEFSAKECAALYRVHRHLKQGYNHTTQMCFGDKDKIVDTCEGDSGGPLNRPAGEVSYCAITIMGVTSFGVPCGSKGNAGIYTRVSHYLPWIESVVWP